MRKSKKNWGKTALYAFVAFDCVGIYAAYQKINPPIDTTASMPQIAAIDMAVPPIGAAGPQFHGDSAIAARADERLALNTAPKAALTAAVPAAQERPALALAAAGPAPKPMLKTTPIAAPKFTAPVVHALAVKTAPAAKAIAPAHEAAPHFAASEAPRGKSLIALAPAAPKAKVDAKAAKLPGSSLASLATAAHGAHAKRDARLFAKAFDHAFGPVSQSGPVLETPVAGGVSAQAYAEPAPADTNAAMAALDQPSVAAIAPSVAAPTPATPVAAPAADAELPPA